MIHMYISRYEVQPSLSILKPETVAVQEFNHLTVEDSGLYICRAESNAGVVERRVQLIVDTLPSRGDITGRQT